MGRVSENNILWNRICEVYQGYLAKDSLKLVKWASK